MSLSLFSLSLLSLPRLFPAGFFSPPARWRIACITYELRPCPILLLVAASPYPCVPSTLLCIHFSFCCGRGRKNGRLERAPFIWEIDWAQRGLANYKRTPNQNADINRSQHHTCSCRAWRVQCICRVHLLHMYCCMGSAFFPSSVAATALSCQRSVIMSLCDYLHYTGR